MSATDLIGSGAGLPSASAPGPMTPAEIAASLEVQAQVDHPHADDCRCGPYGVGWTCAKYRHEMDVLDEQTDAELERQGR
jgi:hypothetical protein